MSMLFLTHLYQILISRLLSKDNLQYEGFWFGLVWFLSCLVVW